MFSAVVMQLQILDSCSFILWCTENNAWCVAGSGQPQAQRFNQPISFVSCGTVGTDPMEIRPAMQRLSETASADADAVPMPEAPSSAGSNALPVAGALATAADNTSDAARTSDAQLQVADVMQAPASMLWPASGNQ